MSFESPLQKLRREEAEYTKEVEKEYWGDPDQRECDRNLPVNAEEWIELKRVLTTYFGVPDQPEFWATIAGHVCSVPGGKIQASYQYLANVGNRLTINAAAQTVRQAAVRQLEERLAIKMKELADKEAADAAANLNPTPCETDVETDSSRSAAHQETQSGGVSPENASAN